MIACCGQLRYLSLVALLEVGFAEATAATADERTIYLKLLTAMITDYPRETPIFIGAASTGAKSRFRAMMIFIGTGRAFLSYKIASNIFPKVRIIIKLFTLQKIPKIRGYIATRINYVSISRRTTRKDDDKCTKN